MDFQLIGCIRPNISIEKKKEISEKYKYPLHELYGTSLSSKVCRR